MSENALNNTSQNITENASKPLNIRPSATSYKSHANFNFERAEQSGLKPDVIIENLKKLDTNIAWENFKDLDINSTYESLKNTPFNINLNNPNKGLDTLLSQKDKQYLALKKLKNYENDEANKPLKEKLLDTGSDILSGALGYENARYRANQERGKEVFNELVNAGVGSDELKKRGIKANALSNALYNERGTLNTAKDILTHNNGAQEELDNAIKAQNLFKANKDFKDLSSDDKAVIKEKLGFFSTLFKDEQEEYAQFKNLQRASELSSSAIKAARMLENVLPSTQFLRDLWSSESLSEKQTQALKDYEVIAQEFGFDAIAYNQNGLYFIKEGKVFAVDENFNEFFINVVKDNKGSLALGLAGALQGAKKGVGGMIVGGAIGGFVGGSIDSILTDLYFENKDFSLAQALLHGAQEGGLNIAGDMIFQGIGAVVKGVKNTSFTKILPSDSKEKVGNILARVSETLSGQNIGAIDRALNAQTKEAQKKANTQAFLKSQSDIRIQDEFKEPTIVKNIMSKIKDKIPLNFIDNKAQANAGVRYKREELLANVLRNKDLSDSLAGQLDDIEARILSQAMDKMAGDFKALAKDYEKQVAKAFIKDESNPSLPIVFQKAVQEAEQEAKNQYKSAVSALQEGLEGESLDLFTPFKTLADTAIADFGFNSDIAKVLMNEVKNLEGRNISIKEALEKRKDLNQILRNFNDNPNTLKKFRIDESMGMLKEAIDTTIENAIEKKIAKLKIAELKKPQGREALALKPKLQALQAQNITRKDLDSSQLDELLSRFNNVENLQQHLNTRADSLERRTLFDLLDSTIKEPHIQYMKDDKTKYLKKFKDEGSVKDPYFYLLVTKDNDKTFITHLKTRDLDYIEKELLKADKIQKGAHIIGELRVQAGEAQKPLEFISPTSNLGSKEKDKRVGDALFTNRQPLFNLSNTDSTTDSLLKQEQKRALDILEALPPTQEPPKITTKEFLNTLDEIKNKENFLKHMSDKTDSKERLAYLNLIEPTLKEPDIKITKIENGVLKEKRFKKWTDGKEFFYFVATKDNDSMLLTAFKTNKINTIKNELRDSKSIEYNADIIRTFIRQGSKQDAADIQSAGYQITKEKELNKEEVLPNSNHDIISQESQLRQLLQDFKEANSAYADIKTRLNDKLTKAIFMDKPKKSTINSMRTEEEWKQAVLDKKWVESIQGLENTIFAKFNPRMQEATQTLMIFRALERHIKESEGFASINLSKALKDIQALEALPLHPKAQNALNIFKELANIYQFANKISGAKGFKSGAGNGALSTSLEGRAKVFIVNRLFKNLFFRVPYIGDKDAVLFHLKKAVQDLKYPRAITLDMLDNPHLTTPSPKTPLNPKGEAFINESLARDINEFASNESAIKDEFSHKINELREKQTQELLSPSGILKAIKDEELLFSKVGAGNITTEDLAEVERVVKALQIREGIPHLHTTQTKELVVLREELKEALSPILNKEIVNKESGLIAKLSQKGLKKMMSENSINKSIENGFSKEEHILAASEIKNLFENAKLAAILEDLKNQKQDLKILRFNTELNINNKDANALITIKQSIDTETKNRIYNIELEELKSPRFKPEPQKQDLDAQPLSQNTSAGFLLTDAPKKTMNAHSTPKIFNMQEPIADFGTNYPEFYHKGSEAIKHLLETKSGQVQGAFYRKDLEELSGSGDISLVWGEAREGKKGYGLAHIIDKHGGEFMEFGKGEKGIIKGINEIVQNGELIKGEHRIFIKHKDFKGMLALDYQGKNTDAWIITIYKNKDAPNPAYPHQAKHNTSTSSVTRANGDFSHSTPKIFNMQEVSVDSYEDFMHYAKLVGFDLSQRDDAKELHKALLAQKETLKC